MQIEIEIEGLKKEKDARSKEKITKLQGELAVARESTSSMKNRWDAQKAQSDKLQGIREQIDRARVDLEQAEREYNLSRAAELRHGRIPEL
jgi:ATP-dependent Clp protease ATP-binding subunit ClpB